MELDGVYLKENGFMGMINQHSWMFLSSYEKLREIIVNNRVIYSMLHLGPHAFEEIGGEVVQSTLFIIRKIYIDRYTGSYIRLVEWRNAKTKEEKALEVVLNPNVDYRYVTNTKEFSKIPQALNSVYWLSKINTFSMKSFRDFLFQVVEIKPIIMINM